MCDSDRDQWNKNFFFTFDWLLTREKERFMNVNKKQNKKKRSNTSTSQWHKKSLSLRWDVEKNLRLYEIRIETNENYDLCDEVAQSRLSVTSWAFLISGNWINLSTKPPKLKRTKKYSQRFASNCFEIDWS